MEEIKLSAKHKQIRDINDIEPNFLKDFFYEMKECIGFDDKIVNIPPNNFEEEPIIEIKSTIEYKSKDYDIVLERTTYENGFLINVNIDSNNIEDLFNHLYELKVDIIKFLKKSCGEVYYIQDTSNQKICTNLYQEIHRTENEFRQLITLFFIRKLGCFELSKKDSDNIKKYSNWYNKKYTNSPFRNIESPLFNVMTDNLLQILKRPLLDLDSTQKKIL